MFADAKTHQKICAVMQRVLIVDPLPASTKLLSELLRDIGHCQIWTSSDPVNALVIAERIEPHIIFVEQCAAVDGAAFTRQLRRTDLPCRKAPVITVSAEATAATIIGARDAGVHEFLRKPFAARDLNRRLEAALLHPRDWIEAVGYVGPDRRRFNSGNYAGMLKRRVDHVETPDEARFVQALKILKSALLAMETDPRQALRSMTAQAGDLLGSARARADMELRAMAATFGQRLERADPNALPKAEIEALAEPLLAYLPADAEQSRPAA